MRIQTKNVYEKSGVVKKPAAEPRSSVVQTGVKEYRRNQRHILAVPKPAPAQSPAADSSPTLSATAPQQRPTLSNAPQMRIYSLSLQLPPKLHQSLGSIRRHRQGSLSDPKLHYSLLFKEVRRRSLVQMVLHTVMPKDRKV